jgi:hypothetical protein
LDCRRQVAVEHVNGNIRGNYPYQLFLCSPNLPHPWKKYEHISLFGRKCAQQNIPNASFEGFVRCKPCIPCVNGERPAFALDDGSIPQELGNGEAIECRGHDQHVKVGAQVALNIKAQRKTQIGMNAPFVKLVKDNESDAGQIWIRMEHARKNAFCHYLNPGFIADSSIPANAVAYGLPDPFV